jgi:hypothetical protein
MSDPASWLEEVPPWHGGMLRLFLSHVSAQREFAGDLKEHLARHGIELFVAHADIAPSRRWLDVITSALRTAHALAALLTDDFRASEWTDQEVGFALCRDIPIWLLQTNAVPHGFMGQYQSLSCDLSDADSLAGELFAQMMAHEESAAHIRRGMVARLRWSSDFSTSIRLVRQLRFMTGFAQDELELLAEAPANNDQVRIPHRVAEVIAEILERNNFQDEAPIGAHGVYR